MNISYLLKNLNDKQQEAVSAPRNNLLILAGAGSGKTRVLTHRIAWLQIVENCLPHSIMAVTFTNKAAVEIRNRIAKLIGINQNNMWVGTFHGLAHRLLRIHYADTKLPKNFYILNNDDQLRLLKRLIKKMNLDEKKYLPNQVMWYINNQKDKGIRPYHTHNYKNAIEQIWGELYLAYQETCDRLGLVDFAELLLRIYELWTNNSCILQYYCERFTNILVDEFQDTNSIQYELIHMLAGNAGKVMIVGDDDQSIYSWRGAQAKNIYRFVADFPNTQIICLEQNYRSTSNILNVANTLIKNNYNRFDKKLWTNGTPGEPISIYHANDELDEARFVINRIKTWLSNGGQLAHCAILYRNNAQSRVLEDTLLQANIPYHIYGGMRFFERQEIKDVLSYLRLITNKNDDVAFERIVNIPSRGIGHYTMDILHQISSKNKLTLWQASHEILKKRILIKRTASALQRFLVLIETLRQDVSNVPLYIQIDRVIKNSGLWEMYKENEVEKEKSRIENLEELIMVAYQFNYDNNNENLTPLQSFLSHIALEEYENQASDISQDAVQLMTLHSAKGLEFLQVFIVGMEDGVFPSQISVDKNEYLEEERRLAYVGVTRAIQKLTLSYAKTRRLYGKEVHYRQSRFIDELPKTCLEKISL